MSTCLITGGAGNLACQLSGMLAARYDRLVLLDIAPAPAAAMPANAVYERVDLADEAQVRRQLRQHRPQAIVHLASLLSGSCEQDRAKGWRVNADGTFYLLEAALELGGATVLFPSSVAAFGGPSQKPAGPNSSDAPLSHDAPQWPEGLYGVTKMACERLGVYYHRRHGLDFRCLRLLTTVSPHAPAGAASAFASHAFVEAVRNGRYTFRLRPDTRVALIYVRDALDALAALLAAPPGSLTQRVYNINALTVTPREIAGAISERLPGVDLRFEPEPAVADLLASWPPAFDDSPARRDWGWEPRFDLAEMADQMIESVRAEAAHSTSRPAVVSR